jgi:hypothetical protein
MPEPCGESLATRVCSPSATLPPLGCLARGSGEGSGEGSGKALSRVASPAGFGLVLLLFFLL